MKFMTLIGVAAIAMLPLLAPAEADDPPKPKKIKGTVTSDGPPPSKLPPIKIAPSGTGTGGRPPPIHLPPNPGFNAMLAQPFAPVAVQWQAGAAPQAMALAATHLCLLTGIAGNFAGPAERIALYIDNGATGGPRWTLNGTSGQAQLRATATCVAKAKFVPAMLNPAQMTVVGYGNHAASNCTPKFTSMNDSFANRAFFISGMAGSFRGDGEMVSATGSNGKGGIRVIGCSGYVDGTLMSLGDSTIPLVKFRTQSGRTNNLGPATFAIAHTNESSSWLGELFGGPPFQTGAPDIWLTPIDEAICGLVNVRGQFDGYGEALDIVAAKNNDGRLWWKFQLGNQTNGSAVSGAARCVARDQR